MKYNVSLSMLFLLGTTTIFCPPKTPQKVPVPLPPQRPEAPLPAKRPHVLPLPLPMSQSQTRPTIQPKTTIFDAGFVEQIENRANVNFRNFPEISLSYIYAIRSKDISFFASNHRGNMRCIGKISAQDPVYLQEPSIIVQSSPNHPTNPPRLTATSCVFAWPGKNDRHIFFIYEEEAEACIEYIHDNNNPIPAANQA